MVQEVYLTYPRLSPTSGVLFPDMNSTSADVHQVETLNDTIDPLNYTRSPFTQ